MMYLTFLICMSRNDFYELFIYLRGGMRKAAVSICSGVHTLRVYAKFSAPIVGHEYGHYG